MTKITVHMRSMKSELKLDIGLRFSLVLIWYFRIAISMQAKAKLMDTITYALKLIPKDPLLTSQSKRSRRIDWKISCPKASFTISEIVEFQMEAT